MGFLLMDSCQFLHVIFLCKFYFAFTSGISLSFSTYTKEANLEGDPGEQDAGGSRVPVEGTVRRW